MFRSASVKISSPNEFLVRLIGYRETSTRVGQGRSVEDVKDMWTAAPSEEDMYPVLITIRAEGIRMQIFDPKYASTFAPRHFEMKDISYACADRNHGNHRIFAWLSNSAAGSLRDCYAVLCSNPVQAQSMEDLMIESFRLARRNYERKNGPVRQLSQPASSSSLQVMTSSDFLTSDSTEYLRTDSMFKSETRPESIFVHDQESIKYRRPTADTSSNINII